MTDESTEILRNARAAFFDTCKIDSEQLEDVYRLVAEAEAEREMEWDEQSTANPKAWRKTSASYPVR